MTGLSPVAGGWGCGGWSACHFPQKYFLPPPFCPQTITYAKIEPNLTIQHENGKKKNPFLLHVLLSFFVSLSPKFSLALFAPQFWCICCSPQNFLLLPLFPPKKKKSTKRVTVNCKALISIFNIWKPQFQFFNAGSATVFSHCPTIVFCANFRLSILTQKHKAATKILTMSFF